MTICISRNKCEVFRMNIVCREYGLRGVKEDIRVGKMRFGREVFSEEEER